MATPGAVVGTNALITPGGAQGPGGAAGATGPPGPTAVSTNSGNVAVLGTDSLVLVPGPTAGNASPSQVVLGSDSRLTNSRTPSAHASTHVTGGSDLIPAPTTSNTGLVPALNPTTPGTSTPSQSQAVLRGDASWQMQPANAFTSASFNIPNVGNSVTVNVLPYVMWTGGLTQCVYFSDGTTSGYLEGVGAGQVGGGTGVTLAQANNNYISAAANSNFCSFSTSAQKAGNLNIVVLACPYGSTVTGVSDSVNGAYTLAIGPVTDTAHTDALYVYYRANIAAASVSTCQVQVTFSPTAANTWVRIYEFNAIVATSPVDVTRNAFSTTTAGNGTVSLTSTNAYDLVFTAFATFGGSGWLNPGANFTSGQDLSAYGTGVDGYRVVSSAGTYPCTPSASGPNPDWVGAAVAFKGIAPPPLVGYSSITLTNRNYPLSAPSGTTVNSGALIQAASPSMASSTQAGLVSKLSNNTTQWLRGDGIFVAIPNVTTSAAGLVPTAPNDTTKFLRGDGTFAVGNIGASMVLGATAADPNAANGIVVPYYKNHPDAIWTYNAFDDHFDNPASGTPNAKWVYSTAGGPVNPLYGQAGSCLFMSQQGQATTNNVTQILTQNLPSSNPLTLTAKVSFLGLTYYNIGAGTVSTTTFDIRLLNASGGGILAGFEMDFVQSTNAPKNYIYALYGPALGSYYYLATPNSIVYFRIIYAADQSASVRVSADGVNFIGILSVSGANSGLSTPPSLVKLVIGCLNAAFGLASIDWIRVTYP